LRSRSPAASFVAVATALTKGELKTSGAKAALAAVAAGKNAAEAVAENRPVSDTGALEGAIASVLEKNADAVARYRGGNKNLIGFFVGQTVKALGGKADPAETRRQLERELEPGGAGVAPRPQTQDTLRERALDA
jgi:aspartyl-tRNA(Asn)/glutamyl-tRNA(Gln) amidotransferase subunit B